MKHQQWRTTPRSNSYKIKDDGNIDDVNNDISILKKNIARIANAVQVTICLLVSTCVH